MKKIVIIGANSYIARNIFYMLRHGDEQYQIKLYDRANKQVDGAVGYYSVDMMSQASVHTIDLDCDLVFMFVGKTGTSNGFDDFDTFIDVNERALLNLLNAYRAQCSKAKIIFPSTRLVYKGKEGAIKEEDEKEFKTIYAINKYACEQYLQQYHNVFGVQYCVFRIGIPYGTMIPGASSYGTTDLMLSKAKKGENILLYGDGNQRRTITHMSDLCQSLIEGAFSETVNNDIFNIGGEDYSLIEMAKLIATKYNVKIEHVEWPDIALKIESGDTVFNSDKLQSKLNRKCTTRKFNEWINI